MILVTTRMDDKVFKNCYHDYRNSAINAISLRSYTLENQKELGTVEQSRLEKVLKMC